MNKIQLMNNYLSNLAVINIKLHNLHWNVTGINFVAIHNFTESLYDEAFENLDAVAEQIKMLGEMPLSTLSAYLKNATIKELEGNPFTAKEVLEILVEDLSTLKSQALEIRTAANKEDDFATANLVEDQVSAYNKHLWFLKTMQL